MRKHRTVRTLTPFYDIEIHDRKIITWAVFESYIWEHRTIQKEEDEMEGMFNEAKNSEITEE